ncbi:MULTISPECIES: GntR family transcriptional regulator [unclassified Streptomyces]|uniref:GntR family transcriptional regulator n=1 Tax=unclassified Streptomyces TaxID=2593676 RepID=UPI00278BC6C4|nr:MULTISPECIES: GntR family transcriptional regulator [unclassified Streptomyces]
MTGVERTRPREARGSSVGVPEQRTASAWVPRSGVPGAGVGAVPEQSRGEHTHSEPPAPRVAARGAVERTSVRGQVLDALRAALVSGELVPGEVYSGPVLGERFGVSATPVREAMQQLAREGAVEVVPNRGFRVTRRSERELAELAEVRALVEVPVVTRLARTVAPARWAELRPLVRATAAAAAAGDRAGYAEADRAFHRAVLAFAGNDQVIRVADDLHRQVGWAMADLAVDAVQHGALLDALEAQDCGAVSLLVQEHIAG